jgi:hypothetical protein
VEKLPEVGMHKRNRLIKLYKGKTGMKETGQVKQTLALAIGQLEGRMGIREVAVLPERLLKQLLAGLQHTLQGVDES